MEDNLYFLFSFSCDIEDDEEKTKEIDCKFPTTFKKDEGQAFAAFLGDLYDDFIEKHNLEHKYGIHDFSGDSFSVGYTTYEVAEDKIDELMKIWKDKFIHEGKTSPDVEIIKTEKIIEE